MKVESPAFAQHESIPVKYTCQGEDISPPLKFLDIPKDTVSLAIIIEDPDAPTGTFDHWIAWNIPPEKTTLNEGDTVPNQGVNHYHQNRYRGPCPPKGNAHRYFFKVFALDTKLDLPNGSTKDALLKAMNGHILGQAELVGTYKRQ